MEIIRLCTIDLRRKDLETWTDTYPTTEMVRTDIADGAVFTARISGPSGRVVGSITLTDDIDEESLTHIQWLCETDNQTGIARLGVDPDFQGLGIGRKLFDFADRRAERLGFRSVRLDVLSRSQQLTAMYRRRGFERVGVVIYEGRSYDVMERAVPDVRIEHITPGDGANQALALCRQIRRSVFIEEQQVPEEIELDGKDEIFEHLLLYRGAVPAGCLRINTTDPDRLKIERIAVLPDYRNLGLGKHLIRSATGLARERGLCAVTMHAQYYLMDYYRALGFEPAGETFLEASIRHITMEMVW